MQERDKENKFEIFIFQFYPLTQEHNLYVIVAFSIEKSKMFNTSFVVREFFRCNLRLLCIVLELSSLH